jgi:conjugal transfer pilus assembly protein TraD
VRTPPPPLLRRSWWALPAFVALLAVPRPLLLAALVAAAGARLGLRLARRRRAHRAAARSIGEAGSGQAVVLGTDAAGRLVVLGERQLSAHGLIVGASGAGKSTTLLTILTAQVAQGRAVVAIDLKGSPAFARELELAATAAGRRFRLWTLDGPEHWNPLAAGNPTELKDKLIGTERFTEPHYQRAAERYLQLALRALRDGHPERPVTLEAVVAMLEPKRLAAAARRLPRDRAEHLRDYLAGLSADQQSAIRGLASRLAIIVESHTGEFLTEAAGGGIDLRAALAGEEVVVFSLNSSSYGKLAAQLGSLAVQDLVTATGHRLSGGDQRRAIVAIDEFSALDSANVSALLARGREAGVSVLLATQELADLERLARGFADQVLGVTALKIAHRQDVPSSAETVARMSGTVREWERSYHLRPGPLGLSDPRHGTLRLVERPVVHPEQIRSLRTGEAVVITKVPEARTRTLRVRPPDRGGQER